MGRNGPGVVQPTGLEDCYDAAGVHMPCPGSGQDGDGRTFGPGASPRFAPRADGTVADGLTGLCWLPSADAAGYPVSWEEGLAVVRDMNRDAAHGRSDWRMPNRRELRSLLSHGAKNPACLRTIRSPMCFPVAIGPPPPLPGCAACLVCPSGRRPGFSMSERTAIACCGPSAATPPSLRPRAEPLLRRCGPGNPCAAAARRRVPSGVPWRIPVCPGCDPIWLWTG
jgi:hypothetical protein